MTKRVFSSLTSTSDVATIGSLDGVRRRTDSKTACDTLLTDRDPADLASKRYMSVVTRDPTLPPRSAILASPSVGSDHERPAMRILVVTETRLYRDGVAHALRTHGETHGEPFQVTACSSASEALDRLRDVGADTMLLDMAIPQSIELVRAAREIMPDVHVLALAVAEMDNDVLACAAAGVSGYVPRECSLDELVAAIRRAGRGELLCPPRIAASLFRRIGSYADKPEATTPAVQLTAREMEVAQLVRRGFANKQISGQLNIEVATVKNHVHNILEKLQLRRRGEIAARVPGLIPNQLSPRAD